MKKSLVTILCAVMLAAALLSGCSGSGKQADSETQKSVKPEDIKAELTMWYWDNETFRKFAAEFNKKYPNIKLNFVDVPAADYTQKWFSAKAAGLALPDIGALEIGARKRLLEVKDAWEVLDRVPYGVDRSQLMDFTIPLNVNNKGELVSLDCCAMPSGVAYRRDLAKKYFGTDDPAALEKLLPDWNAVIDKGKEMQAKSGGQDYIMASIGNAYAIISRQNKTPIFDKDGKFDTAPIKSMLTQIKTMKDNKTFDAQVTNGPTQNASYASGHYMFFPSAPYVPRYVIKPNDKDGAGRWGLMKAPGGAYNMGGLSLAVSSSSKNKQAAWEFIKYIVYTEEGAKMQRDIAGEITPFKPIFKPEFFAQPDPFFGGQDIRSKMIEIGSDKNFLPLPLTIYDAAFSNAMTIGLDLIQKGDTSVDDALAAVVKDLNAKVPEIK